MAPRRGLVQESVPRCILNWDLSNHWQRNLASLLCRGFGESHVPNTSQCMMCMLVAVAVAMDALQAEAEQAEAEQVLGNT